MRKSLIKDEYIRADTCMLTVLDTLLFGDKFI